MPRSSSTAIWVEKSLNLISGWPAMKRLLPLAAVKERTKTGLFLSSEIRRAGMKEGPGILMVWAKGKISKKPMEMLSKIWNILQSEALWIWRRGWNPEHSRWKKWRSEEHTSELQSQFHLV